MGECIVRRFIILFSRCSNVAACEEDMEPASPGDGAPRACQQTACQQLKPRVCDTLNAEKNSIDHCESELFIC